jgi:hypothetical protein
MPTQGNGQRCIFVNVMIRQLVDHITNRTGTHYPGMWNVAGAGSAERVPSCASLRSWLERIRRRDALLGPEVAAA